jgi:hypothetical protein
VIAGEARRRRSGSGWRYTIGGEPVDSVSAIVRDGVPKPNLIGWAARTVAGYAVDHWDDLTERTTSKRLRELERAAWAERDAAAGRGTAIHKFAESLAAGAVVEVPEALVGHVDAYLQFVEEHAVEELYVEQTVVHRGESLRTSYMGTLDLLARLDGLDDVWLLDWKTGASGIWPETALQLAGYAHAQTRLVGDGPIERPLEPIAHAAAVWLRADGYDLVPLDVSAPTFRTLQYAQQVAAFAAEPRERYVGDALPRAAVAS